MSGLWWIFSMWCTMGTYYLMPHSVFVAIILIIFLICTELNVTDLRSVLEADSYQLWEMSPICDQFSRPTAISYGQYHRFAITLRGTQPLAMKNVTYLWPILEADSYQLWTRDLQATRRSLWHSTASAEPANAELLWQHWLSALLVCWMTFISWLTMSWSSNNITF